MLGIDNALRDPVHGWIKFTDKEKQIIDCGLFQRLKYVSQLTSTEQVYVGGSHSRFIHSLGVMTIAGKYMKHILREGSIVHTDHTVDVKKWIQIARIAGLLHDIGHGPFSHAFDRIVYSKIYGVFDGGHDKHRLVLVKHKVLSDAIAGCGVHADDIIKVWTAKPQDGLYWIAKLIIGGPLGSDRIDFILRDSYFTGTKHLGTIAWKRIIYNSTLFPGKPNSQAKYHLCYAYKTLHDIIQALDGRRYMYHGVYLHKTADAASLVIENMMEQLDKSGSIDMQKSVQDYKQFELLSDCTVIGKALTLDEDNPARKWCERLLRRQLPKMVKEQIVDGKTTFDEKFWRKKWFGSGDDENIVIRQTRCITGIDPFKFKQYQLYFYNTKTAGGYDNKVKLLDCDEALENAHSKPAKPYYIVRAYSIK